MSATPEAPEPTDSPAPAQVSEPAATPDSAAKPEQTTRAEGEASVAETKARLAELFPALFKGEPKPLKLRIQADIQERAPGVFTKQALSAFLRRHTGTTSYLISVSRAKQRFDLDGQAAGELSEEHRQVAADELARRRSNQQARREQEEAGRRERFALLRDFEGTKLTTANFCALKGIAPDALDGLLAQARAEAAEEASRPRRPEAGRRGDRGDRGDRGERRGAGPNQARRGPPRG